MLLALSLLACTAKTDDSGAEAAAAPSVAWLTPADAGTVAAGTVACSLVVADFVLEDPAKHGGEGSAEGYIQVLVDGAETLTTAQTTFDLDLAAGAHTLSAALYYVDGDEVLATTTTLCEEGATDAACAPVTASISVTAQ